MLMRKCQEEQKLIARHANVWEKGEKERKGEGHRMGNLIEVEEAVFEGMLGIIRSQGISMRDYQRLPHPKGGWVLNNQALPVRGLVFNEKGQRVSVMPPNNVIYYKQNRKMMYSWIKSVYLFPRIGAPPTPGILINPIINHYHLPGYQPGSRGYYFCLFGAVLGHLSTTTTLMIPPEHIVSLASYRLLADETLMVNTKGIILCPYTHDLAA
ncbi:hypothetical protein O181_124314 [Austropuccinia psidii MF-1]|uniref:Uncharacterized protein n=1 Tax=Austropuccinia psidii MF-1 TaxID=1389203 RepID=A0A9Q3Q459_9BASI|nr:hypothetical protein [Austropuccinia psidii MF-1]